LRDLFPKCKGHHPTAIPHPRHKIAQVRGLC
jgi:hypothetical protein